MRLFLVLLVLLLAAGAYLYFYPETGNRLLQGLKETGITQKKTDRIYKWRNDKGEWQLTDTPPPAGIEYEQTDYREDVNVLPVPPGIDRE